MWRWVKRWADWVRNDVLALARVRRGGFDARVGFEAGGAEHLAAPVPWTADAVVVEITLRLPSAARRKGDFLLHLPGCALAAAESLRPEPDDRVRVVFRCRVPAATTIGALLWKHRPVGPVTVSVLPAETFLSGLTIADPAVSVRLGSQVVPTRLFVADGCRGLIASAVVRAAHPLAPLADLGLAVEFRSERTGRTFAVPVALTAAQRATHEAAVVAVCPRIPRRPGVWSVSWRVGDRVLASALVEAIAARRFEDDVRLLDTRFAVADKTGVVRVMRLPPAPGVFDRIGPCFVVSGGEAGAAGVCRFAVFAVTPGNPHPTQLLDQELLVTDAPTVFAPGLLESSELVRVGAFELRLNGRVLGAAALSPVPPATLTAEGGFKPPRDFTWTAAAEEELQERLGRLGGG